LADRVKVEGVAELKAALSALGTEVATKVGVTADRKAAQELRTLLKETAPYDGANRNPKRRYGHLREQIKVSKKRAEKQGHIIYWVTIGHAFWGFFQEFGTAKMAAHPWMRVAFDVSKERLARVQIDELRTGIEKAAKRLARLKGRG
jgi:HK97 gp10 family phage protein